MCGFVYRRNGWDEQCERLYEYDSILSFGKTYYEGLIDLQNNGFQIPDIARIVNFSNYTVKKQLGKAFQEIKKLDSKFIDQEKLRQKNNYREKWIELQESHKHLGRTELKFLNVAVYSWLSANDKEWFYQYLPEPKKAPPKQNRINWENRDKFLSVKAEKMVLDTLSSNGKPIKISLLGMGRKLGIAHIISKRPNCLPNTIQILKKHSETTEEFIARRIRYATRCFIDEKVFASYSQLRVRAGVMKPHLIQLPKVQKEILESLNQLRIAGDKGWNNDI